MDICILLLTTCLQLLLGRNWNLFVYFTCILKNIFKLVLISILTIIQVQISTRSVAQQQEFSYTLVVEYYINMPKSKEYANDFKNAVITALKRGTTQSEVA